MKCLKVIIATIMMVAAMSAQAQKSWFCGQPLYGSGYVTSPYITSGTVYYDHTTLTYTLDNAVVSNPVSQSIISDGNYGINHTIIVKGNCKLNSGRWGLNCYGNLTITANERGASLEVNGSSMVITCHKTLTIQNCSLTCKGDTYALFGNIDNAATGKVVFDNCKADIEGKNRVMIYISSVNFKGSHISSPDPSTIGFIDNFYRYKSDNSLVTRLIVDINKPTDAIAFEDNATEALCVANWDTNKDGKLSYAEAAAVTDIGRVFYAKSITAFNELQHFTSLTTIPASAFSNCSSLKSITLPDGIVSIGEKAFMQTAKLTSVGTSSENKIATIGSSAFLFSGITTFDGSALTTIGEKAFGGATNLEKMTLSSSLKTIGDYAFSSCLKFNSSIPSSVTSIGKEAFASCAALSRDLTLGESTGSLKIGKSAFQGTGVHKIVIGCTNEYSLTVDSCFYGNTPDDFKLYVHHNMFNWARKQMAKTWNKSDAARILPYAIVDKYYRTPVCFDIDVQLATTDYATLITNYNKSTGEVLTTSLGRGVAVPAGTPFVGQAYTDSRMFFTECPEKLAPSKYNNLLKGTVVSTYLQPTAKAEYIYDATDGKFVHVTDNWRENFVPGCGAYLKLPDELDDIAVWRIGGTDPTGGITSVTGDVDGNGEVDITDANILINILLGKDSESKYGGRADVTDDGTVDVSDVNSALNIILGKK